MIRKLYVVTLKFPRNPEHDPKHKLTDKCQLSMICTDSTGSHHSYCVIGTDIEDVRNRIFVRNPKTHITRIELASFL